MPRPHCRNALMLLLPLVAGCHDTNSRAPRVDTGSRAVVAQAGKTAAAPVVPVANCVFPGDTIELRGPVIIATIPYELSAAADSERAARRAALRADSSAMAHPTDGGPARPRPDTRAARDSALADSVEADAGLEEGLSELDVDFTAGLFAACPALRSAGIPVYMNGLPRRMVRRGSTVEAWSFADAWAGLTFVDASGTRHLRGGFLSDETILRTADSLFGTHSWHEER